MVLKISFATCMRFSVHESAWIRMRDFWLEIPRVYATSSNETRVYLFFFHSESLNNDLPSEWVAIKENTFVIVPNLCHNANNLPLWTWWQPQVTQNHSPHLTSRAKSYSPPKISTLLCCPSSPWHIGKICKKIFCKRNLTLYTITDLPITKNSHIQLPTKWEYINIDLSTQPSGDTW